MYAYDIVESEGLVEVAAIGEYDYSWSELKMFYQPKARRFFWLEDSGCSCCSWGDSIDGFADFSDGDKAAATRAIETFYATIEGIPYASTAEECAAAKAAVRNFEAAE